MDKKKISQPIGGILSGIGTILGASSVFQSASAAHVIALMAGSFGLGVTIASFLFHRRQESARRDE